jgi:cellulose synthase/poly-beta-1,6-N-acetylglucosamine synthase-like glycosyltransferase
MDILLLIFLIPAVFYFGFLFQILFGLKRLRRNNFKNDKKYFVSIIVPFRNETEVIVDCLKSLEMQTYPRDYFEIIFVDDFSNDDSFAKLNAEKKLANTRVISVPNDFQKLSPKKRGIKYGIEKSQGEIILTTDADCVHPKEWLETMISGFAENTGFISGPVKFANSNMLFGKIQQLEFSGLVLVGAGLIGSKKPTICNAANIAFRKDAFDFVDGYEDNQHLASGDDEFLMQKIAKTKKFKVKFLFVEQAVVKTQANETVNKFIQQRKRWASKGLFYNDKTLILKLIMIYLFFVSLPLQAILGVTLSLIFLCSFTSLFLLKILIEYFIIKKGIPLLFENMNCTTFIISEVLHIPYIIFAGIAGAFGNFEWKGRNLKR